MSGKSTNRFQQIVRAHLRRVKGKLCLAALCTLGYTAAELLAPWPLKIIFDHILLEKPLTPALSVLGELLAGGKGFAIVVISIAILLIAAAKGAFSYGQLYLTSRVGHQMVYTLRRELFAHLQRLSLSFHSRARSGELLTKVTSDTNTLKDVFSESALSFVSQVLSVVGMFVVLFALNWRLSLIVMTIFPALLWTIFAIYRRVKLSARRQREREGRIATRISETIGSVVLVRAFGREAYEQQRFDAESSQNLDESVRTARMEAGASRAVEIINAVGIWAAVLFGALQVVNGRMSPGDVLIFTAYLTNMYKPLRLMAKLSTQFSKATVSAERIGEILNIEPDGANDDRGLRVESLRGEIAFQQVSFAYGDKKAVLNDVSFLIAPGQRVALVGASGAGKSTVASLILRFYRPQCGQVLIDGLPVGEYHRESLRREIGVVLQDNILFGASIRENIAYGKPDASTVEIEQAARLAYAHDFISALPDGYDTIIGERGSTLSGGQRQRICLARAVIKQPSILILDEPTAAIDAESSFLIGRAVERLQRGKTTLVISHQFTAMDSFDQIIVLKNGVVVEIGTHAQLLARRGYYFELFRLQSGSEEPPTAIIPLNPPKLQHPPTETDPLRITQTFKRPNFQRAEV
ncbi:MAG: ABC transporter ATP-binding protein [Acidobacteriota bacterium]|nr:ABC transporter ATP-binding protein [Acidobacteriota bacterium]